MASHYTGGCHCGSIKVEIELLGTPDSYHPRADDCDYCIKHAAAYLSDPGGKLTYRVNNSSELNRYRQGDKLADFIFCRNCGILLGVLFEDHESRYGVINTRVINDVTGFGETVTTSPRTLSREEKIQRWKKIWFREVSIIGENTSSHE